MSQSEATQLAQQVCCHSEDQSRLLAVLYRKAGVANRFTALPHRIALDWLENDNHESSNGNGHATMTAALGPTTAERMDFYQEHAFPLALAAAGRALDQAGLSPDQITHLITVSCTGFAAPGVDVELINRLELPPTTERVNVGFMGCHGAINGLRVARAIATADPQARILLAAVELCSLHYRFQWDPERFIGNALFADGAGALAGGGVPCAGRLAGYGDRLVPGARLDRRHDLADRQLWFRDDAFAPRAGINLTALASLAGRLAGAARHEHRSRGRLGDSSRRPAHLECGRRESGPAARGDKNFARGSLAIRQHVVADRALHSGAVACRQCPAPLRDAGLRAWSGGRGGAGGVGMAALGSIGLR